MTDNNKARLTRRQFTHASAAAFGLALFTPDVLWAEDRDAQMVLCAMKATPTERFLTLTLTLTNTTAMPASIRHILRAPVIPAPPASLKVDGLTLEMTPHLHLDKRPVSRAGPRRVSFELPPKTPRQVASFEYIWPTTLQKRALHFHNKLAEVNLSCQTDVIFPTREEATRAPNITKTLTLTPETISIRLPKISQKA